MSLQAKTARSPKAPTATLTVAGPDECREFLLDAKGVVLGRSPKCGVVLRNERISRRHARIFQDPFGRWIVEDLGSGNGVSIGGKRVRAHALLPGEKINIAPFILTLEQPTTREMPSDGSGDHTSTTLLTEPAELELIHEGPAAHPPLPRIWLQELNHIIDRLGQLADKAELYPEVCHCLATAPGTAALVVRLPDGSKPLPTSPEVVTCHVGGHDPTSTGREANNLHLSRLVLEATRRSEQPVMARSIHVADEGFTLTLDDQRAPRAVVCAPVSELSESVDALYLDVPFDEAARDVFEFVQAVARQVQLVRKALLLGELNAERRALDGQLARAREIQAKLTPSDLPSLPAADVALHYEPAMWVGGDYCDVWVMPDERLAFVVGDVSGKGLPAAMVMANLQAALRTAATFCASPADTITHVNAHLDQCSTEEMFVTLFFGLYDVFTGRLEYVNAGHIPPLLLTAKGAVESFGLPRDPVLGVSRGRFTSEVKLIAPGAGLLVVTDGVTEARSPADEEFGTERLEVVLRKAEDHSARGLVEAVRKTATRFRGHGPQQDDTTILALVRPEGSASGS